jgi:hypothetical protein
MKIENTNLISISDLKTFLDIMSILIEKFEERLKNDEDAKIISKKFDHEASVVERA